MEGMWRTLYYEGCLPSNWLGKEIKPAHCSIINDSLLRKEKKQVDTLHDFTTGLQLMIILFNDWSADFLIINWFIILKNDLNDWSIKIVSRLIFFQLINPHQLTACFFFFFTNSNPCKDIPSTIISNGEQQHSSHLRRWNWQMFAIFCWFTHRLNVNSTQHYMQIDANANPHRWGS